MENDMSGARERHYSVLLAQLPWLWCRQIDDVIAYLCTGTADFKPGQSAHWLAGSW
jgi:hypothetical protein